MLQNRLGCSGGPAFSVEAACSSFIYALSIADKFIRLGEARRALVVGSETLSRITDFTDRTTAILFSDGAGALVLEASEQQGVVSTHLHADGSYENLLYCTGGISKGYEPGSDNRPLIRMAGREVFKIAVNMLGNVVDEVLAKNHIEKSDVDWLVPHQANIRIIQAVARKLDLPMERVIVTVQDHGNTSAASVPLALDVGVRDGRIKPGDLVLLEAFGGGLTWGAALVRM
jgi:3-oxoacyl-[acyl-carrier-protein] synthase-3